MPSANIHFHTMDCSFVLSNSVRVKKWIKKVAGNEHFSLVTVNIVFCSDEYLSEINQQYLGKRSYTDVLAFDNADRGGCIEGDIFISIERVRENAARFAEPFEKELHRVIVHGLLHLLGYRDHTSKLKHTMQQKEDHYLTLL